MDTVPRALLPLLAASTEIPLSDRVGLEESFDTFSSLWFDIMRPRTGRDDDGVWLEVPVNGSPAVGSKPGIDSELLSATCNENHALC